MLTRCARMLLISVPVSTGPASRVSSMAYSCRARRLTTIVSSGIGRIGPEAATDTERAGPDLFEPGPARFLRYTTRSCGYRTASVVACWELLTAHHLLSLPPILADGHGGHNAHDRRAGRQWQER